jgi:hypothetical protein
MAVFDFRAPKGFRAEAALEGLGGDYLEIDEVLASGGELALEEDFGGYLMLIESGESE